MFKKKIVGIDIDSDSIKFVIINKKKNEVFVEDSFIENIPADTQEKEEYAFKRIGELIKEKKLSKCTINMIIPADDMQTRGIKIPEIPADEIESVVKREVKKIYGELKDKKIAFQITGKVEVDGRKMLSIFFALVPMNLIEQISEIKFKVDNFDLKIFAAERIIKKNIEKNKNIMIIDIGFKNTILMIFRGENMEVYREINIAGEEISRTISNVLQISFEEAESLKIKYGIMSKDEAVKLIGSGEEPRANQLNFAYQVVMEKLMRKITHSMDYFKTQNRGEEINECHITGGGSLLKGVSELIEDEISGVKIEKLKMPALVSFKTETEDLERLVNAIGSTLLESKVLKIDKRKNNGFMLKLGKQKKYILGLVAILPFIFFYMFTQSQYLFVTNEEKVLREKITNMAEQTAAYDKYDNSIKEMDNNMVMFTQLRKMRYGISGFVYHLSDITLENMFFSELSYDYNDKKVVLKGESFSRDGYPEIYVNDFIKNLEKEYFEVHLKGTQKTLQNVYSSAAFEVDMRIDMAVVIKNEQDNE